MNMDDLITEKDPVKETIEVWKGGKYNYFHNYEDAVYELAIDRKCKICREPTGAKHFLLCPECRAKKKEKEYNMMPYKEWDGVTPLCLFDDNETYFFSQQEVVDYFMDEAIVESIDDLQLVIAEPVKTPTFDIDDFLESTIDVDIEDILPDMYKEVINEEVNEILETHIGRNTGLWVPGNYRTSFYND